MSDSMTRRSLALILALGMGVAGCGGAGDGPSPSARPAVRGVTFARAKAAHQQYGATIRRRYPGVQGTQVGVVVIGSRLPRPGDPVYGIVVLVDEPAHLVEDPQAIGGVPLRFRVNDHVVQH
jgi:hypothetical protein